MYEVLSKLKKLESTPSGKSLVTIVKFRNNRDGIVDVHIRGTRNPVVSVEKSGNGWKAFAKDDTWITCGSLDEVYLFTEQKLFGMLNKPRKKTVTPIEGEPNVRLSEEQVSEPESLS